MQFKKVAHRSDGKLILVIANEAALYSGLRAKYLAALLSSVFRSSGRDPIAQSVAVFLATYG